jgi:hypothetical protein
VSEGERIFFAYTTSVITAIGMVMLLIMVIGSFYLLIKFVEEQIKLQIEKKAVVDDAQIHSAIGAEVRSREQSNDSHGRRGRRHVYDRSADGQGRIYLGTPHFRGE